MDDIEASARASYAERMESAHRFYQWRKSVTPAQSEAARLMIARGATLTPGLEAVANAHLDQEA